MPETTAEPQQPAPEERHRLVRSPQAPARARHLLALFLRQVEGGEHYLYSGRLIVSELVTNAFQHGTRPGNRIPVNFRVEDGYLYVSVEDASSEKPIPRQATPDEKTGRGLLMIEVLSEEWGVSPREGIGKQVWARCAPADARQAL
ncbi:ATP-binding protein [Kitasatospora acidiphila]|uniref:ATP-binding protein n=1 Tax=Kitasatospora acidiphila TaxID=2567942 RepID=UPI003C711211